MTLVVMVILLIIGMPFIGAGIMSETSNRFLGFAVIIIGIILWSIFLA